MVRTYLVESPDGYRIKIFRINGDHFDPEKLPVLMVHGLAGSAEDFVRMGPKRSLAFLMADEGYDVWLGNLRGNTYTSHISLKKSSTKFWNFSYDEHGKYDAPLMIEKVLEETDSPKLHYIGFSMGTTTYFVACHRRPDVAAKIASFTGLAPVTSLNSMMKEISTLAYSMNVPKMLRALNIDPVSVPKDIQYILASEFCTPTDAKKDNCYTKMSFPFVGEDYEQVDWNKTSTIIARLQPVSLKQLDHYAQMALTGAFREYDWGTEENMKKYGYPSPIQYDLTANIAPTMLFYAENDPLADPVGAVRLTRMLKTKNQRVIRKRMAYDKFNHLDFVYAKDVHTLLNYDVIKMIKMMSKLFDTKK
ncbi:lipase 1-like isoform X2 [Arctopsyche grandis]